MNGRGRWLSAFPLLGALMACFGTASAQAGAPFPVHSLISPPSVLEANPLTPLSAPGAFKIKGSNGYSLFVAGFPAHNGQPASVEIFVSGKRDGAIYGAPGTVTETSMRANFGALGEIAVTFHPSGQAKRERPSCASKSLAFDSGFYEGTIRFKGEEGLTSVEATSAEGDLDVLLDTLCPGFSGGSVGSDVPGAELNAHVGPSPQRAHVKVVKNRPSARAHYEADVSEVHEGVSIYRFANAVEPASTFVFDPKVQTATLHPSAPFSGTGRFNRAAKPDNRWSGNLTVDLPGQAGVALTGSGDGARLVRSHWNFHPDSLDSFHPDLPNHLR
jgi:hypothetical protein